MASAYFADREDAGKVLAEAVKRSLKGTVSGKPIVLAIPRGGVPVAEEVAKALGADLDIVVPRKLGAEGNQEYAIGAVMPDGTLYLNPEALMATHPTQKYIDEEKARQRKEAERRVLEYRGRRKEPDLSGRTAIVVDDGIATGATMVAALRWARAKGPKVLVAAAPVAPRSTVDELKGEADMVVCPSTPEPFYAIGAFYGNFDQVTDEEVVEILRGYWSSAGRGQ